ncbi:hypothetical protein SOVF_131880 [Spinacia oleracea]|uniref:Biotin carboxyl carrier protein of acetyl-CoA carboxylase n=1 Tax=Spinacia oleracea TaxID=3562 RepID=A0A9R0HYP1_SPIOL|nr:biotin carboxyl carrier protein of acetyl-CoA carboxylase 1, chloroplastic-like [Spinacia oleracea]KNA11791.1 hypothetical protein SOVF_131880 [Spinacia oleracea]
MSTCIPTAAAVVADKSTTSASSATTTSSTLSLLGRHRQFNSLSNAAFSLSSKPNLRLISKSSRSVFTHTVAAKAQLNNAGIGETSSGVTQSKSGASSKEIKNGKPSSESAPTPLASEESISEFIAQVAGLIKLVDSRDIVELQMKQHDCELLIRKKEAISQLQAPPVYMMQAPSASTAPPQLSPPISAAAPAPASQAPAAPAPKPVKSSVPPLKSPMSGTFYRSPAPNAPAFVKVGDKVQKGQVVCIIEAMKLMNEIEADQAGTVIEVVAEDGKPVSLDTPLFIIQP